MESRPVYVLVALEEFDDGGGCGWRRHQPYASSSSFVEAFVVADTGVFAAGSVLAGASAATAAEYPGISSARRARGPVG